MSVIGTDPVLRSWTFPGSFLHQTPFSSHLLSEIVLLCGCAKMFSLELLLPLACVCASVLHSFLKNRDLNVVSSGALARVQHWTGKHRAVRSSRCGRGWVTTGMVSGFLYSHQPMGIIRYPKAMEFSQLETLPVRHHEPLPLSGMLRCFFFMATLVQSFQVLLKKNENVRLACFNHPLPEWKKKSQE